MSGAASWLLRVACVLWAFSAAVSCDHIGRELVGEQRLRSGGIAECTQKRPCGAFTPEAPVNLPEPPLPLDLSTCPMEAVPRCIEGLGPAAHAAPNVGCIPSDSPESPQFVTWSGAALGSLNCRAVESHSVAADGGEMLNARSITLEGVNFKLESVAPQIVELNDSELRHVSFELHGPITLRLLGSRTLEDVRVAADGGAHVEVEGGRCLDSSFAATDGVVSLRRVQFERLRATAQRLELESVAVTDAAFASEEFDATDSTLTLLTVEAERSVLSNCIVMTARFSGCTAFTSVLGTLSEVQLDACEEPARLYGSSVRTSRIDGAVVLDRADVTLTELGQPDAAPVQIWESTLTNATFCGDQQPLELVEDTTVICARCDLADHPVDVAACSGSHTRLNIMNSESCPGLANMIPVCDPEPAKRMRPPLF